MEYTEPLTLIRHTETIDAIGNVINIESSIQTFAKKKSVGTKEFYNATAVGITPTAELQIKALEYNGETEVIYKNQKYSVIRSVNVGKFDVVLVVGVKQGAQDY